MNRCQNWYLNIAKPACQVGALGWIDITFLFAEKLQLVYLLNLSLQPN